MADDTDILRIVVEVVAERNAAVRERDAARAEVAAVEAAICDRGVSERDCSLPLATRVDNLIVDLRTSSLSYAQTVMESEQLRAEVERLRAELCAVATIAHEGGLAELGEGPPLTAIRRRTLCWWDRTGSRADAYARVRAAMKHKETNQ